MCSGEQGCAPHLNLHSWAALAGALALAFSHERDLITLPAPFSSLSPPEPPLSQGP